MRKILFIGLLLVGAAAAAPARAQTASDALASAWQQACAEAVPGTAFFDRCQEILNAGPGSDARRSAAALGNNLEIFAAQARLMMRIARARGRAAAHTAKQAGDEGTQGFYLSDPEAGAEPVQDLAGGERWDVFGSASLIDSEHHGTGFERGYGEDGRSLLVGAEYRWSPRWSAVLGLQHEDANVNFLRGSGRLDSNTDEGTLALNYLGTRSFSASLSVSVGRLQAQLQREIDYTLTLNAGQPDEHQVHIHSRGDSENSAHTRGADLDLGWDHALGAWTLHLGGAYSWQRTSVSRLAEDNDVGLDFLVLEQKITSQRTSLELQMVRAFSVSYGVWQPYFRLRLLHEAGDDPRRVFTFFRGGQHVFRLAFGTGEPERDFAEAGIGVVGVFPHGWQAYAGWQKTLANEQLDENRFDVGWRREF